jgi:hypothetical protein
MESNGLQITLLVNDLLNTGCLHILTSHIATFDGHFGQADFQGRMVHTKE